MPYERQQDKEPAKADAVHWARLALTRAQKFTDQGAAILVLNPTAFEDLAKELENGRRQSEQNELAPQVRDFGERIRALIQELQIPLDEEKIEEDVRKTLEFMKSEDPDDEKSARRMIKEEEAEKRDRKVSELIGEMVDALIKLSKKWKKEEAFRVVKKDAEEEVRE